MMRTALALLVVGCGNQTPTGITPQPDNTLSFPLGTIEASRIPAQCNVVDPPLSPQDAYQLIAVGADPGIPRTILSVAFHPTLPVDTDLAVTLGAFGILSYALGPDGEMTQIQYGQQGPFATQADDATFEWGQGVDATQVDATPLDSATVRIPELPGSDADPLAVDLDLRFHDGGVLHVLIGAPLLPVFEGCPAG